MFTLIFQLVLFLTAVTAGRVCAAQGHRKLGIGAFIVLECGYLQMWFGTWWIGLLFVAVGTWLVIWCQNNSVTPMKDDGGKAT